MSHGENVHSNINRQEPSEQKKRTPGHMPSQKKIPPEISCMQPTMFIFYILC